jgi:hypothetical protein
MFFISIFKRENRRSNKERRNSNNPQPSNPEMRTDKDRRTKDDRRNDVGRRTGLYFRLPDDQKGTVDTIINILERKLEK